MNRKDHMRRKTQRIWYNISHLKYLYNNDNNNDRRENITNTL